MKLIEDGLIESSDDDFCGVLPDDYGIGAYRHAGFQDTEVT